MKNFLIFISIVAIVVAVQAQGETDCPKPSEAPPCVVSCCNMCKAAQSGSSPPEPQPKGPHLLCGCPACIIKPKE